MIQDTLEGGGRQNHGPRSRVVGVIGILLGFLQLFAEMYGDVVLTTSLGTRVAATDALRTRHFPTQETTILTTYQ